MKKALIVVALAFVLVFAFASTAFAAYSGSVSLPGAPSYQVGQPIGVQARFTKGSSDATITATTGFLRVMNATDGTQVEAVDGLLFTGYDATVNAVYWSDGFPGSPFAIDAKSDTTDGFDAQIAFLVPGTYTLSVRSLAGATAWAPAAGVTVTVVAGPADVDYGSQATGEPTVIGANGASAWSYKDLADAAAKYEGGYAAFDNTEFAGDYDNPHGGYDTATNKCKVCHAVHRAEGAYYLLRADSQDDACDYCHIGGSAHSSKVVYDLNSAGKATSNGHTIGASTYIPDSSIAQWTESVTLETVDADGDPLFEIIEVRAYDEQKNDMYRFARHHGHSAATGAARRNYVPVGPLALRCMSCHQVHNAEAQTWNAFSAQHMGAAGEYEAPYSLANTSSYKLLKQFPSGTFIGVKDSYGQIPLGNISIVPETTLTAGVNFDAARVAGVDPTALSLARDFNNDGDTSDSGENVAFNKPMWVAQNFDGEHDPAASHAEASIASAVNNAALSVWCADCHNLNIGGWEHLANEELGFKAHTERTHPAPYTGAHSGPGQCYSCHRNDLPRIGTDGGASDSCSQCHYGTGNYRDDRYLIVKESDFPHSGEDGDYKMLGSYSILRTATDPTTNTTIDEAVIVGPNNLDAVCLRCHGGIGTYH